MFALSSTLWIILFFIYYIIFFSLASAIYIYRLNQTRDAPQDVNWCGYFPNRWHHYRTTIDWATMSLFVFNLNKVELNFRWPIIILLLLLFRRWEVKLRLSAVWVCVCDHLNMPSKSWKIKKEEVHFEFTLRFYQFLFLFRCVVFSFTFLIYFKLILVETMQLFYTYMPSS